MQYLFALKDLNVIQTFYAFDDESSSEKSVRRFFSQNREINSVFAIVSVLSSWLFGLSS